MALPDALRAVVGAKQLYDWFGYWPTFHDAEVICLHLNRKGPSILRVHTWEMTSEVSTTGHYVLAKDVVVDFMIDIATADDALELFGFSHQNVIFGLTINKDDSAYKLEINPCYGLGGSLKADNISIRIAPGKPESDAQAKTLHT